MAEPTRRIILDGVEFAQIFQFPRLFGSCTAALQPARLLIALLMVTAVVTFGRIWDGATDPDVSPRGLMAGPWSIEDAAGEQNMLQQAMRMFALDSELPGDGEPWPTLHPDDVLEDIRLGYALRRNAEADDVTAADDAFGQLLRRIEQRAPLGTYEATAAHINRSFHRMIAGGMALSTLEVIDGGRDLFVRGPVALWNNHPVFTVCLALVMLLVYVVGGGALCRMAACQFATDVRLGLDEAIDFALVHWIRLGIALLLPIVLALIIAGAIALVGILLLAPVLDWVGGLLYGLALLAAFVLAFVVVGYGAGIGMIVPAVASENCDGPDAGQKAYAYVYQRPLHLLGYIVVALIALVLGYLVVNLFAALTLNLAAALVGWSGNTALSGAGGVTWLDLRLPRPDPWAGRVATGFIMFWQGLVVSVVIAYVVSFACDATTRIFLLMRRSCDEQSIEEIWWPGLAPGAIAPHAADRGTDS